LRLGTIICFQVDVSIAAQKHEANGFYILASLKTVCDQFCGAIQGIWNKIKKKMKAPWQEPLFLFISPPHQTVRRIVVGE